jgi:hypothetical protein
MRDRAMATLADLMSGGFAERMRIEAAARIIVTARRVAVLAPEDAAVPGDAGGISDIAARWDARVMTVAEFAESLNPAELAALLDAAPAWAEHVWPRFQPAA